MSRIIRKEIEMTNEVPRDVRFRVKEDLEGREIDCSDIPELTDWLTPPTIIKVSFDDETARTIRDKAAAKHQTPAQAVNEIVMQGLRSAQ